MHSRRRITYFKYILISSFQHLCSFCHLVPSVICVPPVISSLLSSVYLLSSHPFCHLRTLCHLVPSVICVPSVISSLPVFQFKVYFLSPSVRRICYSCMYACVYLIRTNILRVLGGLRLFYLVCIVYRGCFNLFCNVWVFW